MARFAKGSKALAISDRSGAAFPYREMGKEWTDVLAQLKAEKELVSDFNLNLMPPLTDETPDFVEEIQDETEI